MSNCPKSRFQSLFRSALLKKYGKIPSCNWISSQFNFHSGGEIEITGETVRKWLNGFSFPTPDKVAILVEWLDLKYEEIYKTNNDTKISDFQHINNLSISNIHKNIISNIIDLDQDDSLRVLLTIYTLKNIKNPDLILINDKCLK
jgi:hypothetical protein